MGSTIATAYAIEHQSELNGLILSGAALKAGAASPKRQYLWPEYSPFSCLRWECPLLMLLPSAGIKLLLMLILMTR